jgi:halimadienyl-diphosphate synthase
LLQKMPSLGKVSTTAYDTAWVARLGELDYPLSEAALEWVRANQLPDGSWGVKEIEYYHDKVLCTLASMIALAANGDNKDKPRIERGQVAVAKSLKHLQDDISGETVGFESIVPTLIAEAQDLGALNYSPNGVLTKLSQRRQKKIAYLPKGQINRHVPLAFSAEMAGKDGRDLLDVPNLQEMTGAVGQNPSSTVYFVTQICYGEKSALRYLRRYAGYNGTPHFVPFEIFEQGWIIWNLALSPLLQDDDLRALCQPSLGWLRSSWEPGRGVGHSVSFTPKDGDDTAVVFEVLNFFGQPLDIEGVLNYESEQCFRSFEFETHPSTTTNIHILSTLKNAGYTVDDPLIQKIWRFLQGAQIQPGVWSDKWHISPFYSTSHMIIACAGYAEAWAEVSVKWMVEQQRADGSWGYYLPTAEETAYCLQALCIWRNAGNYVNPNIIKKGAIWLEDHMDDPNPPLWIAKCIYSPPLVVRSSILSALALV